MKFADTVEELRRISAGLKAQGVTVEKLDDAVAELAQHLENIEKIEDNIDAIKSEVVSPLKEELAQNKVAGRFSIFGFWVGAFALVVTIGTLLYQQGFFIPSSEIGKLSEGSETVSVSQIDYEILDRIQQIQSQLLFPSDLTAELESTFIERGSRAEVARNGSSIFFIEVYAVTSYPSGGPILGGLRIYRGQNLLGRKSLINAITRSDNQSDMRTWFDSSFVGVAPGDTIILGNVKTVVMDILSTDPEGRLIGDDKSGVVFNISTIDT